MNTGKEPEQNQTELDRIVQEFNKQNEVIARLYRKGIITYEELLTKRLDVLKQAQSDAWAYILNTKSV